MKRLTIAFSVILIMASCQFGDKTNNDGNNDNVADTVSSVKTFPPEPGCSFSMNKIVSSGAGGHIAVTGTKRCDDGRVFQEVTLYAPGEPINSKKTNVYSVPDTLKPVTANWSGDTLVIMHHSPATTPTIQQFMVDSIPIVYAVEAEKEEI